MNPAAALAALAAAGAMLAAAGRSPVRGRLAAVTVVRSAPRPAPRRVGRVIRRPELLAGLAGGLLAVVLLGGRAAFVAAPTAAVGCGWLVSRLPSAAAARRREALAGQAPTAVQLLAAAVAAGAPTSVAVAAVAAALPDPAARVWQVAARRLTLGLPAAAAWAGLPADPAFAAVGRLLAGAESSGAATAGRFRELAAELRADRRAGWRAAAAVAGVRMVGPLVCCYLPAFVLVGVLPLVLGLLRTLR